MKTAPFFASLVLAFAVSFRDCNDDAPSDTFVRSESIASCTEEFVAFTEFIGKNQFGINVQNLRHHNIFRFDSKKAPWRPINGLRATVGGRLDKYFVATVHADDQKEFDWCLDVTPGAAFLPALGAGMVEGEVTPAIPLRKNEFFQRDGRSPLVGRQICMYGPWVLDIGNVSST